MESESTTDLKIRTYNLNNRCFVCEGGAVEATVRAADSVAAPPDPDGGAAHAARLRQAVRDVPRPLRRPPHHHAQEEGSLKKGAISSGLGL